jgi:prepilin-type N-terminal cleavage/methylation domain-containing protein
MLKNTKIKQAKGFTIIEVLIVLAIAGLILLIVFLAVPALQRNAHNTSIKNDVAGILGGVNEFVNNNNGSNPTTIAVTAGKVAITGAAGTNASTANVGYVTSASWTTSTGTAVPTTPGTVVVVQGVLCNATNTGSTTTGATARNYVALFSLEGGALECQAS